MKKELLIRSIFFAAILLLVCACQKESLDDYAIDQLTLSPDAADDLLSPELNDLEAYRRHGSFITPFRARFHTNLVPEKLGEVACQNPNYPAPNYQRGAGFLSPYGKFKVLLTFCSGANGAYGGAEGYLEFRNGDRLYIKIDQGQVILGLPQPHPVYDAYFKDPFEICGGTGRFKGATGYGTTNSLVDLWNETYPFPGPIIPDHRTDHVWKGRLILPRGKKPIRVR